jgi:DNA-directed RNA polymerase subunit RPC12/RpoP
VVKDKSWNNKNTLVLVRITFKIERVLRYKHGKMFVWWSGFKMVKCSICRNKIKELFLGKLKGTVVRKEGSSKKYYICFDCQKKFKNKEEMMKEIK